MNIFTGSVWLHPVDRNRAERGGLLGDNSVTQAKDNSGSHKVVAAEVMKSDEILDVLEVEPTEFATGLGVGVRKRGSVMNPRL